MHTPINSAIELWLRKVPPRKHLPGFMDALKNVKMKDTPGRETMVRVTKFQRVVGDCIEKFNAEDVAQKTVVKCISANLTPKAVKDYMWSRA